MLHLLLREDGPDFLFDFGREHVDALIQCLILGVFVIPLSEGPSQVLKRALLVFGLHENRWYTQLPLLFLSDLVCQYQWNLLVLIDFV